ncbi:unnamed protein product [Symbiodinium sp. CCMP2456]|nr:unnamed protein product [Symbiodinium sp. CCMP2456]
MDMGNTEAQLIITKSKSAEIKSGYEELTVKEMVKKGFSATKIENIVRKGGTPDPDAPHCLESIVYLCRKKKDVDESEKISQVGQVKANIKANAKAVAPLMHLTGAPVPVVAAASGTTDAVLQYAANAFASGTESALSKELKKEYNAANICYDLPKDHELRVQMEKHKGDLENQMDTFVLWRLSSSARLLSRRRRVEAVLCGRTLGARAPHLYIEGYIYYTSWL